MRIKPKAECLCFLHVYLFGTPGQDQLSGSLHNTMGHRHSNSVLQQEWQRGARGLGWSFLSSHSSHKTRTLRDFKGWSGWQMQQRLSGGQPEEAKVRPSQLECYWALTVQPTATNLSHKCQQNNQHSVDGGHCPWVPEMDRPTIYDTISRDCLNYSIS